MILRYYSTVQYQSFILAFIEMSLMTYHLRQFYFLGDQIEEYQRKIFWTLLVTEQPWTMVLT